MKVNTTSNIIHTKALTAEELLALEQIAYDEENPITNIDNWAGATMKMNGQVLGKTRGKQKSPTKITTTIRLDKEIIEYFKATGAGWQTRLNHVLREHIKSN